MYATHVPTPVAVIEVAIEQDNDPGHGMMTARLLHLIWKPAFNLIWNIQLHGH